MFSNLKIAARLYAGFGLLVVLAALLAIGGTMQFATIGHYADLSQRRSAIVIGLKDAYLSVRQGRVMTWSYAATGDESYLKSRDGAFALSLSQIAGVEQLLITDEGRQLVKAFKESVTGFAASATAFNSVKAAGSPEYQAAIAAVNAAAKRYAETNDAATSFLEHANKDLSQQVHDQIEWASTMAFTLGLACVAAGLGAAWLIGRGITGPLKDLRTAMDRLAANDLSAEILGTARKDEIGAMARTVEVFKTSAQEVERLRAAQEAQKARAADEQKQTLNRMADSFRGPYHGGGQGGLDLRRRVAKHRPGHVHGSQPGHVPGRLRCRRLRADLGQCSDGGQRQRRTLGFHCRNLPSGRRIQPRFQQRLGGKRRRPINWCRSLPLPPAALARL